MKDITVKDIVEATEGSLLAGDETTELKVINIDSRVVHDDQIFVPIIGERIDAHKFVPMVMKYSPATLTDREFDEYVEGKSYIKVDNTEKALGRIGKYIRNRYEKPVIGVTGSVGKTTTREMITAALSANLEVFNTEGNMNSQIGVPITLSKIMDEPSDIAVLELGISDFGNMDALTEMARPDIAVVTMIGVAHIEFMKTQENICEQKLRIAARMDENGVLFLNGDDPFLKANRGKETVNTYYYGTAPECDYRAENIRLEDGYNTYDYCHNDERITVKLSAMGKHNVLNSLVGMAISDHLGLDLKKAAAAFSEFKGLRQKVFKSEKGYTVIDDTYNASPDSMKASLNVLSDIDTTGKRYAVLGDMFELGENAAKYHKEVGEYIKKTKTDVLIAVGELAVNIADGAKDSKADILQFGTKEEALEYIKSVLTENDTILLKASNGMKLSEIVTQL